MAFGSTNAPGLSGKDAAEAKRLAAAANAAAQAASTMAASAQSAAAAAKTAAEKAAADVEKVNKAIEEGGGIGGSSGGNTIKITFEDAFAGATFTVSDGDDIITGTVPEGLVASVKAVNCNSTYTIKATASNGVEYSATVTTGAYYGQYTASMAVFDATINVTAVAGAEVTATMGGIQFNATAGTNGVAAIKVNRTGTYTITATKGGRTSTSTTVNVTAAQTYTATVKLIITAVPSQAETLTYTGSAQSPSFNNYDSDVMTLGGTTSATNAGSNNANFTPKPGYQWSDGSTTAKTVSWSIAKAAGTLSLNKTTMALNGTTPTGTITVTREGDGAITATSNNTAVATVSVSGTTVTVTAIKEGSATITVKVAVGTNHTAPADKTCSVTATNMVHIYGVQWDGTSVTKWTRTDEAASFTDPVPYTAGKTAAQCSSPFDNLQPWAGMVKSERTGGTMVAIPKFWYKLTQSGKSLKIQIADKAVSGYSVSPAHMNRGDGKGERDVIYVGRYHCASDYKSKTNQSPKVNITRSAARSGIHALGTNIWQMDTATRFTIWLLYLVEFADWNSQKTIGKGCGNNSAPQAMGYTDTMPYHTGTTQSSKDTFGLGTQYRWIEGLWDDVLDWEDGCYNRSSGLMIILNPNNYSDSSGGVSVGTPSNGYPSAFTISNAAGFPMFVPTEANGNDQGPVGDFWNFSASGPVVYVGGYCNRSGYYGLFYRDCAAASDSSGDIGSRLHELP